jgi:outer membrane protein
MPNLKILTLAGVAALGLAGAAHAQDADTSRWFVHVGPADVILQPKTAMTAGGQPVPGANVSIPSAWTVEGEIGYYLNKNIAVAFAGGYPPEVSFNGAGSVAALGRAGQMQAGPSAVNLSYHFNPRGPVQPYVGAGVAFLIVWSTKDAALTNLKASDAAGAEVQAGVDFMLNKKWGAFVDYKRAWLQTTATGMLGAAPVSAKVDLNPTVLNAGVTYRF